MRHPVTFPNAEGPGRHTIRDSRIKSSGANVQLRRPEKTGGVVRRFRSVFGAVVVAWTIFGCVPHPPTPTVTTSPTSQAAHLCEQLERVYSERAAVGDAFRLVVGNDLDGAVEQARLIRSRLDDLLAELPAPNMVPESRTALRAAIQDWAGIVDEAAAIIDRPGGADVDRDIVLAEGRAMLGIFDDILGPLQAGDPVTVTCPDLDFAVEPVSFPPPPTNADLGLPDIIGDLTLESHIEIADSRISRVLKSVDVDPATVRQISVDLSDIDGGAGTFQIVDRVKAPPAALANAVREETIPEAKAVAPETIAGFEVFAYDYPGEQISVHVAVRRDRVVILHDLADQEVRQILAAMPFELPSYGG
jgi:hypothetical protein